MVRPTYECLIGPVSAISEDPLEVNVLTSPKQYYINIKTLADINPNFMKPYFIIKEMPYDLRNGYILKLPSANSMS